MEKTTLRFAPGMNCIIGPNGCGKSNVLDALRWVLGEQSFSVLRCARTEDLIFAGSAQSPPLNYAEVRLVLSTEDRPELGAEVEIRRRFFRSGESEYYLNRQPCRLRDIQDLFLSAGIGTKAYSIFDLRQMREIIGGNIRAMFEEAATLAKFRDAKEDCQRKIDLTQRDLTRLEDIIAERERVVRSLQRQAAKLRAYQRLKEEENSLRLVEMRQVYQQLSQDLTGIEQEIRRLEEVEAERLVQVQRLENELHNLHSRLVDVQAERDRVLAELNRGREALNRLETRGLIEEQEAEFLLRGAQEAEKERERLEDEVGELEQVFNRALSQLNEANTSLTTTQSRLEAVQQAIRTQEEQLLTLRQNEEKIRNNLSQLLENEARRREAIIRLEAAVANSRKALERVCAEQQRIGEELGLLAAEQKNQEAQAKSLRTEADRLRQELASRRSRYAEIEQRLEEIRRNRQKVQEEKGLLSQGLAGLAARVARVETEQVRAVFGAERVKAVSRLILPRPGWERACEAALYFLLDFFTGVDGEALEFERLVGGAPESCFGFLLKNLRFPIPSPRHQEPLMGDDERLVGRLSDFVDFRADAPALLRQVVASFQVVKDNGAFFQIIREEPAARLVTKDGFAYFGDSRLVLAGEEAGTIRIEAKIREQEEQLWAREQELKVLDAEEAAARKSRTELAAELDKFESQLVLIERDIFNLESKTKTATAVATELKREQARLAAEQRRLDELLTNQEAELGKEKEGVEALGREIEQRQAELANAEQESGAIEARVKAGLRQATEVLAEVAERRAQIQRLEVEIEHLKRSIEERRRRSTELAETIRAAQEKAGLIQASRSRRQGEIEQLQAQVQAAETELARYNVGDVSAAAQELEKNLAELRQEQQQAQELLFRRRLERAERETKIRGLMEEAERLGADSQTFPGSEEDEEQSAISVQRLQQVRQRLSALEPVNPLAAEEFEQEKGDLDRLLFQREDVLQAKENLEQSLLEIDRHAREQFLATYEQVRQQFQQVFKELFLEGEADLILMNSSNPLESEVAIIAKPRGKNPKRLEQLSDGEKAMLAVSLLFAFYRVKPAPFCFLDEIDAPLDDANVNRFANYLKTLAEKTQVIIITHNRATVEHADVVFGVTSEQPGVSKLISVSLTDYRSRNARLEAEG